MRMFRGTVALLCMVLVLAACSHITPATMEANTPHWQGRLALKVHSSPIQTLAADFALQGSPHRGQLSFSSPLGNTLALVQWSPTEAILTTPNEAPVRFSSLDALTTHLTGTPLPIASLFDWLHGNTNTPPDWEADLQALPQGRITAHRLPPQVPVELKIMLDQ